MGEESKVRVNKSTPTARSVILASRQYPQGGAYNNPTPAIYPSPLMGEESKSLSQCLTRDQRVNKPTPTSPGPVIADLTRPFIGTRMMKNFVLQRCKRTRWHSVIRDSSNHRTAGARHAEYLLDTTVAQAHTAFKAVSTTRGTTIHIYS